MKKTAIFPAVGIALFATGLLLQGCGSAPEPKDLMAEEARSGDEAIRPVAMKGEATYDGGNVEVVATVARGFRRVGKNGAAAKGGHGERSGHRWFKRDTDAFSEDYNFDYGDSDEEQKEAVQDYIRQAMARRAAGSPMPPVTLHITIENRGTQPLEIVPIDVDSDLGNFAARPEKLTVAPGQKAALEPMISQLGVTSDDIPLTLSFSFNGKKESQVVHVKNILAASLRQPDGTLK
ncbi:MAG TPA: hypothetical protein VHE61_13705 [Opitutaceae bacterium]|nr:hypothetical protein [Opitutaceae bacterium]